MTGSLDAAMDDEQPREVMWFNRSGGGVRSTTIHDMTKVHLAVPSRILPNGRASYYRTLCGRVVGPPSKQCHPEPRDPRCSVCARIVARWLTEGVRR